MGNQFVRMISMTKTVFLFATLALCSAQPDSRNSCKAGWFDASFLNLGCLLFNTTAFYSWEEANVYCQKIEQATLVEIGNEQQLDFIQMELDLLGGDYWWTSGTDAGREGPSLGWGAWTWWGTSSGTRMSPVGGSITTVSAFPEDWDTSELTVTAATRHKSSVSRFDPHNREQHFLCSPFSLYLDIPQSLMDITI